MFRSLVAIVMIAFSASAFATQVDAAGLSDAQVAEIRAIAAKRVAENAAAQSAAQSAPSISATTALAVTWGQQAAAAAEGFARAMGIAARELNVSINDFLKSPAGILTAAIIVWKVAGSSIIALLYGGVVLVAGLVMVRIIYMRLFTKEYAKVEYSNFGGLFKGTRLVRVPKSFFELRNDGEWLAFWVMIALFVVVILTAGAVIG